MTRNVGTLTAEILVGLLLTTPLTAEAQTSEKLPAFMTGVGDNVRAIFDRGRAVGNRPNVFAKVGDSLTASPYFLYDIGDGRYDLGEYAALADTITFFSSMKVRDRNSFSTVSIAANAGWSSARLLGASMNAPPECGDDPPLVCEYKLTKPALALIMIGTNDWAEEAFRKNLRRIVEITIERGIIPVLSTIPPARGVEERRARVDTFNVVIRELAREKKIPLWDYNAAMKKAPNEGISPDGVHPSVPPDGEVARFSKENLRYGYTLRNLTALQVLDSLRRLILAGAQ